MVTDLHARIDERRRTHKHEDALTAGFWVVEALNNEGAAAALRALCHADGLCRADADLAQLLAAKLGQPIRWRHMQLGGDTWREGRGE